MKIRKPVRATLRAFTGITPRATNVADMMLRTTMVLMILVCMALFGRLLANLQLLAPVVEIMQIASGIPAVILLINLPSLLVHIAMDTLPFALSNTLFLRLAALLLIPALFHKEGPVLNPMQIFFNPNRCQNAKC